MYIVEKKRKTLEIPSKQKCQNNTGIPTQMKSQFENTSGFSFDDVRVHYGSDKPAQLQALAYTQGNNVYIAPGQEQHLGHELSHVVQQKQGRVRATTFTGGVAVNDDLALEKEADRGIMQCKMDGSVVQRRQDAMKIIPSKIGADPAGIGLTAHHAIPAGLLEKFYGICEESEDENVADKFEAWKLAAASSADETKAQRDDKDTGDDYGSACQWMAGNIFIGPNCTSRVDDYNDERKFDEAAFKGDPGERRLKHKEAFDKMIPVVTEYEKDPSKDPNPSEITEILDILISIAEETELLHPQRPVGDAYDISDWCSVGNPAIAGMENSSRRFDKMCELFEKSRDRGEEAVVKDFRLTFKKYVKIGKIGDRENKQLTMFKHNYSIISEKYKQIPSDIRNAIRSRD